jgi:arylsulfatase A-like enzyme
MPPLAAGPSVVDRSSSLLALALWAGLVTGFLELGAIAPALLGPSFAERSRDAVWMIPAFDGALLAVIGVVLVMIGRLVHVPWRVAAGILAGSGVLLLLLVVRPLHWLAALALAVGIGTQVARFLASRSVAGARLVRRSLPWLIGSVAVLAGVSLGWRLLRERRLAGSRPVAERAAPNVLLLILDTVRAADLSLYGYARPTTPVLERLAQHATTFERAFATASWTTPSHASIFTGRWPSELGVTWDHALGPQWPLLTEVLRARGYATAAFVANDVYAGWESGLARGFEHFDDYPRSLWTATQGSSFGRWVYSPTRRLIAPVLAKLPVLWRLRLPQVGERRSAEQINDAFLAWLDQARPKPYFAFLNFMDAHVPYSPPDSFRYRFQVVSTPDRSPDGWETAPVEPLTPTDVAPRQAVYDGSIAYLDSQLGRLFNELKQRGLLDNTLVVVTADHGDEFAEHGLVDHGNSLYRNSLQVPLVLWFPGRVPEGRRVRAPVSLRNVAATVLDLLEVNRSAPLPGRSLARFWSSTPANADTIVASTCQTQNQPEWYPASRGELHSIAFDGWRYIRNEGDGAEQLYDFRHDLLERWNLAGTPQGVRLLPQYRAALAGLLRADPVRATLLQ